MVPEQLNGAVASTGFDVLRALSVLPSWIFNRVRSREFIADVCQNLQGVVYPAVRPRDIRAHVLPIPPLPEQHRIVEAIESYLTRLDDAVASLERVQRNLERYRASVLNAAVEGRLVPTEAELARREGRDYEPASVLLERILAERKIRWIEDAAEKARAKAEAKALKAGNPWTPEDNVKALAKARVTAESKYKEPTPPDITDLPDLPEGWCWATIDCLAVSVAYGSSSKASVSPEGGVPVLRMGNIRDGALDLEELKYLPHAHGEFPALLLAPGDLLFNRTNSAELVGKSAVYGGNPDPCSFASYLIRVRLAAGVHTKFVAAFINSIHGRRWIRSVVAQQVGQANVNGTKLKACVLPVPPQVEQERIVSSLDQSESRIAAAGESAVRAMLRSSRLRQSILKWAFEGKLVDQDPDDEPATALLERIKAEREAAPKARRKRKKT